MRTMEEKLARLKNYRTRYEVAMTNGSERYLVVYMSARSFRRLLSAVQEKLEKIVAIAKADVWMDGKGGLTAGDWKIAFTGRTQREAILGGELQFIGRMEAHEEGTGTSQTQVQIPILP
jgi:hypothetical protein